MSVSPSVLSEWTAARNGAAVFDLSQRGQIEVTGPDAVQFLHNLSTNDIKSLAPGQGCESFLTTNKARIVAHGFIHRLLPADPPTVWFEVDPGTAKKTDAHLTHFIVSEQVEVFDHTESIAQFHLCGPHAVSVASALTLEATQLGQLKHAVADFGRITRNDLLGLCGFDLTCSMADAPGLLNKLVNGGAMVGGPDAFNVLRVEAGVPLDGVDFDGDRFVVEVNRNRQAISYTKGCYLGQEPIVMARDRGHVNRVLLGLKVDATEPIPVGSKVTRDGQTVGQVASSVWSPLVGKAIALAYLQRGNQEPGTAVQVVGKNASVTALPFAPN